MPVSTPISFRQLVDALNADKGVGDGTGKSIPTEQALRALVNEIERLGQLPQGISTNEAKEQAKYVVETHEMKHHPVGREPG